MAAKLIIAPEVEEDLGEAYDWYEARRTGLGEEFLSCVDACLQAICRMPEMYVTVHENYRRGLVRRFPYSVFYEYANNSIHEVYYNDNDKVDAWTENPIPPVAENINELRQTLKQMASAAKKPILDYANGKEINSVRPKTKARNKIRKSV